MFRHREIKKISDLLEKYRNTLTPPQKTVEKAVLEACREVCGVTISPEAVRYTVATNTLYLSPPSVVKQELLLHKEELQREVRQRLGEKGAGITII